MTRFSPAQGPTKAMILHHNNSAGKDNPMVLDELGPTSLNGQKSNLYASPQPTKAKFAASNNQTLPRNLHYSMDKSKGDQSTQIAMATVESGQRA